MQFVCRTGKTIESSDRLEGAQLGKRQHLTTPISFLSGNGKDTISQTLSQEYFGFIELTKGTA